MFLLAKQAIPGTYYIQTEKDGNQIRVNAINKASVTNSSWFNEVKIEKMLRKSQAQFCEKLRELSLKPMMVFL